MVRKIQFIGNGLYGAVGVSQQAARLGIEQPVDKVAGRLVGGLANDAREVRGRYGEAAGVKVDGVLALVVAGEQRDELLEQPLGVGEWSSRIGPMGNPLEHLQHHDVQQVLQPVTLVGPRCNDVAGELPQVVGQILSQMVGQVKDGRLSLEKEERVLLVGRVGSQLPFEEGALAQQMQGHEVGALPGERYQQAGPEEQHVVLAHGVVAIVQRGGMVSMFTKWLFISKQARLFSYTSFTWWYSVSSLSRMIFSVMAQGGKIDAAKDRKCSVFNQFRLLI